MELKEQEINNGLFRDAVIGVLAIVGALAGILISMEYAAAVKTIPLSITTILAGAGFITLYKALRNDKKRLSKG